MNKIQTLLVNNNQLQTLPETLVKLENLNYLSLANNQLTKMPQKIEKLKNLKTLILSGNQFAEEEKQRIKAALPNCAVYF